MVIGNSSNVSIDRWSSILNNTLEAYSTQSKRKNVFKEVKLINELLFQMLRSKRKN